MPEALAITLVFFVSVGVIFFARSQANDPARQNPHEDLARLKGHAESLQRRLRVAQKENWSDEMVARIATELETASRQIAKAGTQTMR